MAKRILDCHSFDSTLDSLATIVGIHEKTLTEMLRAFTVNDFPIEPADYVWQNVIKEEKSFDGVYWFHFTRTMNPESFRENGIKPLNEMIEPIWLMINELIGDRLTDAEKVEFRRHKPGHHAFLYGLKVNDRMHWGPYAMLLRESAFCSRDIGNHDYLVVPEIIADICICLHEKHGLDLQSEFYAKSQPCIVKFLSLNDRPDLLRKALMYVWATIQNEETATAHGTCFDAGGVAIPPEQIINVEIVSAELTECPKIPIVQERGPWVCPPLTNRPPSPQCENDS